MTLTEKEMLLAAVSRFEELRVLVIGDVMLDVYEFCYTEQSKPIDSEKPGKLAYRAQQAIRALGGAGNVAANLAALGARTSLVGVTGNDEHHFSLREQAEAHGIAHFLVRDGSRPTTTKIRLYLDDEYLLRRDAESSQPIDRETSATMVNETVRELGNHDVLVISDYNKGLFTEENAAQLIKECRMHNVPVIVDFKPDHRSLFAGADLVAPNQAEAADIIGFFENEQMEAHCRKLHEVMDSRNTVVTLGARGICGVDEHGEFFHVPGHDVPSVDAVGCGDTVRAGLALGTAAGLSLRESAVLANASAAVIVQKPATACLTRDELSAFVEEKTIG